MMRLIISILEIFTYRYLKLYFERDLIENLNHNKINLTDLTSELSLPK